MPFPEPTHDNGPRTTATSGAEGRLKLGIGRTNAQRKMRHKKKYGTLKNFPKKRKFLMRKLKKY